MLEGYFKNFATNSRNFPKISEDVLKAHANGPNNSQHCCVLLGVCDQQCCVRLHGPKSLTGFKLYATSANKCQHCCGSMQTDATSHNIVGPNNVACCWPTMLRPFAWTLRLPKTSDDFRRFSKISETCMSKCLF